MNGTIWSVTDTKPVTYSEVNGWLESGCLVYGRILFMQRLTLLLFWKVFQSCGFHVRWLAQTPTD